MVQNIQALLDNRLDSVDYWTTEDARILDEKVLIIGSGTWQKVQRKVLKDSSNIGRKSARIDQIEAISEIPEELLLRFNSDVICLDPMFELEV